jgi:hypothetical protein
MTSLISGAINGSVTHPPGFYMAPFGPDGECLGIGFWAFDALSAKWIALCSQFLATLGDSFRAHWSGQLDHIETKFTSQSGAGIGTFYVRGKLATSCLYLSGSNVEVEAGVRGLFVDSLRRVPLVQAATLGQAAFADLFQVTERPLVAVVVWGNPEVNEDDAELIRELSTHFAAAFFKQEHVAIS